MNDNLLNTIYKRNMRTSSREGGFGGDDPNKNNWNWLNDKFKKMHGENDNPSDLQKLFAGIYEEWSKEVKQTTTKQKVEIDKISSGLKKTLEDFNINVEKLEELSKNYHETHIKINEINEKVDKSISELKTDMETNLNKVTENYNSINTNLNNYIQSNNANIEGLQQSFQLEMDRQRYEILQNLEQLKKENSEDIGKAVNDLRGDIDNIVTQNLSNGISRLINFILTLGGLFDKNFMITIMIFIFTASLGLFLFRNFNIKQAETKQEATNPNIQIILPQLTLDTTSQQAQTEPQVLYPPERSLIRSAIIKALKWLNIWLEKK